MPSNSPAFSDCLYYSSGALARVMNKLAEEAFAPLNLAPSYAFLLMAITRQPGIQVGEVGRQLMLQPSTLTRLVDKMERSGFLRRVNSGRFVELFPTEKCRLMEGQLANSWEQLKTSYSEVLGQQTSAKLARLLYDAREQLIGD